jgi:hypothetical protein
VLRRACAGIYLSFLYAGAIWLIVGPTVTDAQNIDFQTLHVAIQTLWITTIIGVSSLVAALASLWIAKASRDAAKTASRTADDTLQQAKEVADRDLADWRQSKWFDLYVRARDMGTALEYFQTKYKGTLLDPREDHEMNKYYNDFMSLNRRCMTLAVIFPKNDVIENLAAAAAAFRDWKEALSPDRLKLIEDSIEEIRTLALLRPEVLLPPEMQEQIRKMMTGKFNRVSAAPKPDGQ